MLAKGTARSLMESAEKRQCPWDRQARDSAPVRLREPGLPGAGRADSEIWLRMGWTRAPELGPLLPNQMRTAETLGRGK
jgi:hypothetical protein